MINYEKIYNNIETKIFYKYPKAEVARKMGIKPQSLNTILKNIKEGRKVTLDSIERIAKAGEINYKELFE